MSTHSTAGVNEAERMVVVAPAITETGKAAATQAVANAPLTTYSQVSGHAGSPYYP